MCVELESEHNLYLSASLEPFLTPQAPPDVRVRVSWAWDDWPRPDVPPCGRDLLAEYYRSGDRRWMLTSGGPKGYVAAAVYTEEMSEIDLYINDTPFLLPTETLDAVLRFIPIRAMLLHRGVLFLHASQVELDGSGVIFTAPSGTGKTTQARLWQSCRGARITSNDRTLLWRTEKGWFSSGYPVDGSSPVGCADRVRPACIVCLQQAEEISIRRLSATARSLAWLFPQLVIDTWDARSRVLALERLLQLFQELPVYQLSCTPDERAVECLEREWNRKGEN